jgi:hypothetical protein
MRRAAMVLALAAATCSGPALAHGGEATSLHAVVGPVAFLVGGGTYVVL